MGHLSLCRWLSSIAIVVAANASFASTAQAADIGPSGEPLSVQVHGFVSPGFIASTKNNYLARSSKGSFEFTEVGLNFTTQLTDKLRTGAQLFARDLGTNGNYSAKLDWFYLDYRWDDALGFRAGRVKVPFGLYNDTSDVDAARVPILLPQSIYSLQNRDFLFAQTGGELYGRASLRSLGALEYRIYAGAMHIDLGSQSSIGTRVDSIGIPWVAGERLMWETPLEGLRLGGSMQILRVDANLAVNNKPLWIEIPAALYVASLEYSANDFLFAAEYSRWWLKTESSDPSNFPRLTNTSERAYAMASYRTGKVFTPGVYYSLYFPDADDRNGTRIARAQSALVPGADGRAGFQHDIAATLRFDINSYWLVKLEGHFMHGTAGLSSALNDNKPLSALTENWGVFLAKTTVHF